MEVSRHWRLQEQRYKLVGETCDSCGVKLFPPRDVCLECKAPAYELYTFTGLGEIYSFALVKLEEGPIVTAQLTDIDESELSIGMPVEMVTRKLRTDGPEGMIVYGYKFRPLHSQPVLN